MSVFVSVKGIRPKDEKWQKMKVIYDACRAGDVAIPEEVSDFFEEEDPNEEGVIVDLKWHSCCRGPSSDSETTQYDILVDDLPVGIKTIRFEVMP